MPQSSGQIVDFLDSGKLKLGCVMDEGKSRVQLRDQNGREHSVAVRQIMVKHPDSCEAHQFSRLAGTFLDRIQNFEEEVDTALLWESLEGHSMERTAAELAEIYFGEADSYQISALFRALLEDPIRFKFRSGYFVARSRQQVDDQLHAARRQQEKAELRDQAGQWLASLLSEEGAEELELTPVQELVVRRIEDYLQHEQDDEARKWLSAMPTESSPKMTAFEILSALGRLPEGADPWLMTAGISPEFGKAALDECASLRPYRAGDRLVPPAEAVTFSIDDEGTREVDDALSVVLDGGATEVSIHISDVSYFIERDSFLDREAHRRRSTLYLPQQVVRMLPERLSCDLASLVEGKTRPVLTLRVRFLPDGEIESWEFLRMETAVSRQLTYEGADGILSDPAGDPLSPALRELDRLTLLRMEERIGAGALLLRRPELKVSVDNGEVFIKVLSPDSTSRRIVSELMILANHLAAEYAVAHKLPFIFRAQSPPSEPISVPEAYDPVQLNEIFSRLEKGKLSLIAQEHAGLGLESYSQITSPIRRFLDLVGQRQLIHHCEKGVHLYESSEMMKIMATAQEVEGDVRAIERKATRYYVLRYLLQAAPERLEAVVLKELAKGGYLVETNDLFIRGHLASPRQRKPGDRVELIIDRVDPEANVLIFTET